MTQAERDNLIAAYADGELHGAQLVEFEARLANSPEVQAEVEAIRALRRAARRTLNGSAPAARLRERVLASIAAERAAELRRTGRVYRYVTGLAAAVLLVLVAYPLLSRNSDPGSAGQDDPSRRLTSINPGVFIHLHRTCFGSPNHDALNAAGEPVHATRRRLSEQFQFAIALPDLDDNGYEVYGACECELTERESNEPGEPSRLRSVHVYYVHRGTTDFPVSFFSVSERVRVPGCFSQVRKERRRREYEELRQDGVTLLKWDEGEASYVVCSRLEDIQLRPLADSVRFAAAALRQVRTIAASFVPAPLSLD